MSMYELELLKTASFSPRSLEDPNAWAGHLPFANWIMRQTRPDLLVELGTHTGNSYFAFCQSVVEDGLQTRCFAVDTWQGDEHALAYGEEVFNAVAAANESYAHFSRLLRMRFDDALAGFADQSVGLLHIDGLHTYEAVSHDFETWLPKLRPGAVVIFHDTNVRENGFGVWKLWSELIDRYPRNVEFFHSHGLGVLQIDGGPPDNRLAWLEPGFAGKQDLVAYFSALGAAQLNRFSLKTARRELDERNSEARALGEQLAASYERLDTVHREMNNYIDRLKDQIGHLEQQERELVDQREREIGELTAHIQALEQETRTRDQALQALEQETRTHDQALQAMRASTSWRVTRPLRWLMSASRRRTSAS